MEREKVLEKLKKLKALAERGVGGEKETAIKIYKELMEKYEISETEEIADTVKMHWFGYKSELEENLLTQIFYKVTGSAEYYTYTGEYKRRKKRGCQCTEIEAAEIKMLFNFYTEQLKKELEAFMLAFRYRNNLYPDETARCYVKKENDREYTEEETRLMKKAGFYSIYMDRKDPPKGMLCDGQQEEKDGNG